MIISFLGCNVTIPAEVVLLNSIVLPHKQLGHSIKNEIVLWFICYFVSFILDCTKFYVLFIIHIVYCLIILFISNIFIAQWTTECDYVVYKIVFLFHFLGFFCVHFIIRVNWYLLRCVCNYYSNNYVIESHRQYGTNQNIWISSFHGHCYNSN